DETMPTELPTGGTLSAEAWMTEQPTVTTDESTTSSAADRVDTARAEQHRLHEAASRHSNWKRWGPYLADRQWATVREDYSGDGSCWDYFPHDHARSRAY